MNSSSKWLAPAIIACCTGLTAHAAEMGSADTPYWGTYDRSGYMGSIDYAISIPTSKTRDFVPSTSWLGFNAEGYQKVSEKFGVGLSFSWIYFSDEQEGTYQVDTATVTGKRFSSIDSFPILMMGRFMPDSKQQVVPFVGAGLGPLFAMQRGNIGILGLDKTGWQFALAGEAGLAFYRKDGSTGIKVAARYVGGFETDSIDGASYLSLSIGLLSSL